MFGRNKNNALCGERHESQLEGYSEKIESKDMTSFKYCGTDFFVSAKRENEMVNISCNGGGKYNTRDGSLFSIKYETKDDRIFKSLQEVIDENGETHGNGRCVHVDGLPGGLGDTLEVLYASGEKIYKTSNQHVTVRPESAQKFYELFHNFVVKDGYEFSTEGSNVKLFDDADEEYVQGTWKGTHFGNEIMVTFDKNHVTITVDGKITDEKVQYTIFEGTVVLNKLKEGITEPKTYHDYEFFEGVSTFVKKNWFTMTAYFLKDSYSTCDLHNFDKEKPMDE